jgi:hypothetical protein
MNPALLALLSAVGAVLGKLGISLLTSLLTEAVLKKLILLALKRIVDKTQNEIDNQVLAICMEAWGEKKEEPKADS